jgi:DNA-binding CsgD family transcriptional regulator
MALTAPAKDLIPGELDSLRELVRALADFAAQHHPTALGDGSEVILDFDCDGLRCILLRAPSTNDLRTLSPREEEIARLVAVGQSNKMIAAVLDISIWTVGTYLRRIFAKLGVGSRAAMVAKIASSRRSEPKR